MGREEAENETAHAQPPAESLDYSLAHSLLKHILNPSTHSPGTSSMSNAVMKQNVWFRISGTVVGTRDLVVKTGAPYLQGTRILGASVTATCCEKVNPGHGAGVTGVGT